MQPPKLPTLPPTRDPLRLEPLRYGLLAELATLAREQAHANEAHAYHATTALLASVLHADDDDVASYAPRVRSMVRKAMFMYGTAARSALGLQ